MGTPTLRLIDPRISAREASRSAKIYFKNENAPSMAFYSLRRDFVYQLDFYLQSDLQTWTPRRDGPVPVIFTSVKGADELRKLEMNCDAIEGSPAVVSCKYPPPPPEW